VGHKARWEYFRAIYGRYEKGDRKALQAILNEFCLNTGYHRKHAIRLLNGASPGPRASRREVRRKRALSYGPKTLAVLTAVWEAGRIPVVGAAEGDVADVDAVDSQALRYRPRDGAGVTGDQSPADGSPAAGCKRAGDFTDAPSPACC